MCCVFLCNLCYYTERWFTRTASSWQYRDPYVSTPPESRISRGSCSTVNKCENGIPYIRLSRVRKGNALFAFALPAAINALEIRSHCVLLLRTHILLCRLSLFQNDHDVTIRLVKTDQWIVCVDWAFLLQRLSRLSQFLPVWHRGTYRRRHSSIGAGALLHEDTKSRDVLHIHIPQTPIQIIYEKVVIRHFRF